MEGISEKIHVNKLSEILKGLNPLSSYSMAFLVYNQVDECYKTIGSHYLVNNTTNPNKLINSVYKEFDNIAFKHYNFLASDKLMIKY